MDEKKPGSSEPSSQANPSKSIVMDLTTANRSAAASASLYMANEITPEAVISELNLFRPTTTSLPLWSGSTTMTQGVNYSIISSPNTTTNPMSTDHSPNMDSHSNYNGHKPVSTNSYDIFPGPSSREDSPPTFQLSPRTSFSESGNLSPNDSPSNSEREDTDIPNPKRKKRTPVPTERKDAKYWDRRKKNNDAAKRSRDMRRRKVEDELKSAKEAILENQKLKQEIDVLKAEINSLRRLLKDANTTLSLWIRARQNAEPNVQLPPMLRGSNVSFVNFPSSSTT